MAAVFRDYLPQSFLNLPAKFQTFGVGSQAFLSMQVGNNEVVEIHPHLMPFQHTDSAGNKKINCSIFHKAETLNSRSETRKLIFLC